MIEMGMNGGKSGLWWGFFFPDGDWIEGNSEFCLACLLTFNKDAK